MSGYSCEDECPNCGGMLHISRDRGDIEGNYQYCLDCGKGQRMKEDNWTLEELNKEREYWELPPLTEFKKAKKLDSISTNSSLH